MLNHIKAFSHFFFPVWRTCLACAAVFFALGTASAQTNPVDIPDRMTLRLVNLEFCEDGGRSNSEIESLLLALGRSGESSEPGHP